MTEHDKSTEPTTDEELLEALDKEEERNEWDPEPGDTILGTVTGFEHPLTKDKKRLVPVLILECEEGPVRVAVVRNVLKKQLAEENDVQIGDRVAIRFLGKKEGKTGNDYFGYKTSVAHREPRNPAKRFTLKPHDDLDLTDEAVAEGESGEVGF